MIPRPFWQQRIKAAWREAPIVWLCGVRRSGKTTLTENLGPEQVLHLNCDLPTVEDMVREPNSAHATARPARSRTRYPRFSPTVRRWPR